MNPSSPLSTAVHRLSRRNFIQYASIWIDSSFIAGCSNSNQPSTSNSQFDKVTFGTNWIAQAEHGGFYQAMSTKGCAYATDIYKDYGLDVSIKMGGPQVPSGTQLLIGGCGRFLHGLWHRYRECHSTRYSQNHSRSNFPERPLVSYCTSQPSN
ncbi:hypothetical protein [uncultured Nostoc sp.]|uniref:hypothetical protein n=1 Tax=uncultured Nostoc sp. TaxID=340711 RepID=UPI0035CA69ED